MHKSKKSIGSSFYSLNYDDQEFKVLLNSKVQLKGNYAFYYSGRNAFLSLFNEITSKVNVENIWLPSYFCHNVINCLTSHYSNISFYYINPFDYKNKLDITKFAQPNDIVVLNNFWGLFTYEYDTSSKKRPIVIEDHSHGWLSKQSLNSKADYCICSIRKTYPIPLGAITWMPKAKVAKPSYEAVNDNAMENAYKALHDSMDLKRAFIKDGDTKATDQYLALLNEGEGFITASKNYSKPGPEVINGIKQFMDLDPNPIKNSNLKYLFDHIKASKHFKIIKRKGFTSFGLLLVFKDETTFYSFKKELINNNIYPANLWPHNDLRSQWKYFFNIHVDFRYNLDDMKHIAKNINSWSQKNA